MGLRYEGRSPSLATVRRVSEEVLISELKGLGYQVVLVNAYGQPMSPAVK